MIVEKVRERERERREREVVWK